MGDMLRKPLKEDFRIGSHEVHWRRKQRIGNHQITTLSAVMSAMSWEAVAVNVTGLK